MNQDGAGGLRPWLFAEAAGNLNQGWKLPMPSGARPVREVQEQSQAVIKVQALPWSAKFSPNSKSSSSTSLPANRSVVGGKPVPIWVLPVWEPPNLKIRYG